jgi:polyhydroxyalkanoate depolymerase
LADLAIKALAPAQSAGTVAFTRNFTAAHELIARAGLSHDWPPFGIDSVMVGDEEVAVHEKAARITPFGALLHFKKAIDTAQPRVLLVAPLSGHFATLLRATIRTPLPITTSTSPTGTMSATVPRAKGRFGFDEYIQHIVEFLEAIEPGAHVVAVCQPCVAVLIAAAVMAQDGNPAQHDPDGGADRHQGQSHQGQHQFQADRMIRAARASN